MVIHIRQVLPNEIGMSKGRLIIIKGELKKEITYNYIGQPFYLYRSIHDIMKSTKEIVIYGDKQSS
jgi:hypothetical protein